MNLLNEGPDGIELGSVKTSVMTAKTAIVPSRTAIRRGGMAGTGLPRKVRWTGIAKASGRNLMYLDLSGLAIQGYIDGSEPGTGREAVDRQVIVWGVVVVVVVAVAVRSCSSKIMRSR